MALSSFRNAGLSNTNTLQIINADFSNAATGTYTDTGVNYKYVRFTGNGTLTITTGGVADVLVVGGGGGGTTGADYQMAANSGEVTFVPQVFLASGSHTVVIGAGGGSTSDGSASSLTVGSYVFDSGGGGGARVVGTGRASYNWQGSGGGYNILVYGGSGFSYPGGSAGTRDGNGLTSSITGTSVLYAGPVSWASGTATANTGRGGDGNAAQTGAAGVVIVRVRTN